MQKILSILCLVLLSSCSQEPEVFTGPFVTRDGVKYDQNTNEPVNGIEKSFDENGQLRVRANYIDGKQDGLFESFHENGQLSERLNYKDDERDGLYESFDENGQLEGRRSYKDDEIKYFDENGNLIETYINGVLVE